ncbi:MAG: hypothetical protein IKR82_01035 [Bacteroidales bacterium]|nr:hypothetical protein [Bacteroidales bacterium]
MKQEQNTQRSRYERPALKTFQITLEGGCCQMNVSPLPPLPGSELGEDQLI